MAARESPERSPAQGTASVAVVIPVYNGEAFVRRAVDSVLRQTHAPAQVLLVDDGSTDGTGEILASYGVAIRVIREANSGPSRARNVALREIATEFVAFLDADDWWAPEKLEKQVQALRENPSAVASYTGLRMVDEKTNCGVDQTPSPPESLGRRLRWCNPCIPPSCVMARREKVERCGGFNERQFGSEDWCLWFELGMLGPFCLSPEPLTFYRVSSAGLSGNAAHMFNDFMKMLDDVLLKGLSGWRRGLWRRRIIAYQAYKSCLTARAAADAALEWKFMRMSLSAWPSPLWAPERFKAFAITLTRSVK